MLISSVLPGTARAVRWMNPSVRSLLGCASRRLGEGARGATDATTPRLLASTPDRGPAGQVRIYVRLSVVAPICPGRAPGMVMGVRTPFPASEGEKGGRTPMMNSSRMHLVEICEEIGRIERVRPHLRDLGDLAAQDHRLAVLRTRRDALAGPGRPA